MADKPNAAQTLPSSSSSTAFESISSAATTSSAAQPFTSQSSPSSILPRISQSIAAPFVRTMTSAPIAYQHQDRPPFTTMAATNASKEPKKLDISNLMSPPDPVLDSFGQSQKNSITVQHASSGGNRQTDVSAKHPLPMSPPISPYSKTITTDAPTTPPGQALKDPVLYPVEDSAARSPQPPLFAPADIEDHRHIINDHVRAQSPGTFGVVSPPKIEDYMLALSFKVKLMTHYTRDPKGWLRREREFLTADRHRRANAQRAYPTIMPAKPIAAKPPRSQRTDRVSKPQQAPRPIRSSNGHFNTHGTSPVRPSIRVSATPEPGRNRTTAPNREDKNFGALPDYCPPLDSLPNRPNSLKVDWRGQPIDLSSDPNAKLLHPDEVTLASNLRLDCATYLTSKRRIFDRRLECLHSGKEFRKTDAQQACKIDVNKASKLWTAFDKVGWLDAHWVKRFL